MYRIIHTSKYWSSISAILVIASIGMYFLPGWGLNLGIDFTGGSSMEIAFEQADQRPEVTAVQETLAGIGIDSVKVNTAGDDSVVLRMQQVDNEQRDAILEAYSDLGAIETSFSSIGPSLGQELQEKSLMALLLVLVAIVGYVSYVFRKVSKGPVPSWMFGIGAIAALAHDIIITVGVFVVLGKFFDVQVDAFFITALLTILGFSVNDTIVVYDRIREGMKDRNRKSFLDIVNDSVNATITRSLNTSITTLLVLFSLYLFGGESIRYFVLALMIGITAGTYSSIFIASPLLLFGQKVLKK